jgi:hypothetical protein
MKQTKQFVRKLLWILALHLGLGSGVLEAHPGHVGHGTSGSLEMFWAVAWCAAMVAGVIWLCARGFVGRRGAHR